MIATAKLMHLRIAPRKVRLVADLVRGKRVEEALNILQFTRKRSALALAKLIKSAVANASEAGANVDRLVVGHIAVGGGPVLKRFMPRAMGRAAQILKRTSHVTLGLEQAN
ncbi:MAG: 50S ribosomal protein L22 [Deltaproteobacteria bacterium]|nr:50S ribosomal protein L22 [Deltaproteobacteria bacterium]